MSSKVDKTLPELNSIIRKSKVKPAFGESLENHLETQQVSDE